MATTYHVQTREAGQYYHRPNEGWCQRGWFDTLKEARKRAAWLDNNRRFVVQIVAVNSETKDEVPV